MSIWIARRPAAEVDDEVAAARGRPLAGLRLGVKDNIDVAGLPTTAGCPAYAYDPDTSAPVVTRLVEQGAVVVGKTALDQFATGLVGTRSPHGVVESPVAPGRVAGGSSSGSAAAVASGAVDAALGTDTAGSGRVPAMFCGVVGLKPTRGWLPTRGVVPACASFDCVSVFAREVALAARVVQVAAGPDPDDARSRRRPPSNERPVRRVGVLDPTIVARWCDPAVAEAYAGLDLGAAGLDAVTIDLTPYVEAGDLLYGGALVAERHAAVGAFVDAHPDEVDPVVGEIIRAAGRLPASQLAADLDRLAQLRAEADRIWEDVDAVVVPTAPSHPTPEEVAADPIGVNARLGRFTNGCNLLDWCAASVPLGQRADGLPFGVTVLGPAWTDRQIWVAAAAIAGQAPPDPGPGPVLVAVAGAHLEGQPLNHQLTGRGAWLVARTATAPAYRMVSLPSTPPKPGVVRVAEGGAPLEVEVWALDPAGFGAFVDEIPPPLAIGTIELADRTWVNGFVCEAVAVPGSEDITAHGGWRAWLAR